MKIRLYDTPTSWWYIGTENKKGSWFSVSFLTKKVTIYYGPNSKYIQKRRKCEKI